MKQSKHGLWKGAFIWLIGVPFLLGCFSLGDTKLPFGVALWGSFFFFLFATGPFALFIGGTLGYFVNLWRAQDLEPAFILVRSLVLGMVLCIILEWTSIGFLYSFGAIARHLGVEQWLAIFGPLVVAFLPKAIVIGGLCGVMTGIF